MLGRDRQISGCLSLQCWLRLPQLPYDLAQLFTVHLQQRQIQSALRRILLPFSGLRSLRLANSSSSYLVRREASCARSSRSCLTWAVRAMLARNRRQYSAQYPSSWVLYIWNYLSSSQASIQLPLKYRLYQNTRYKQQSSLNNYLLPSQERGESRESLRFYLDRIEVMIRAYSFNWVFMDIYAYCFGIEVLIEIWVLVRQRKGTVCIIFAYKQITKSRNQVALMHTHHSFSSIFQSDSLQALSFFQQEGIAQQAISNMRQFVNYCYAHPKFSHQMIALVLNTPLSQLQNTEVKAAVHAATEVLTSEEPAIAELFFQENREEIPEEGVGQVELKRHELVTLSLQILKDPEANESCLGYLHKIFAFLIRHNSEPVLDYFQTHPKQLQLLLNNLRYCSVGSLVGQLLTSEDRSHGYRHQKLKVKVMEMLVEEIFERVEEWDSFEGILLLVEDIFNSTKHSDHQHSQDFKRAANRVVDHDVMQRLLDILLDRQESSFHSASVFLELLFTRINSQAEDNAYYSREAQPSMSFQVEIFFDNMPALIQLVAHIDNFKSLTKIAYLSFLEGLIRCGKARKHSFALCQPAFIELLGSLNRQAKAGLYKNKLYNLITAILQSATSAETTQFLQKHSFLWEKYFASIKDANYEKTKIYNKNESSAFDVALIKHLSSKDATAIQAASVAIGKDVHAICKKYETKIASQHSAGQDSFKFEPVKSFKLPNPLQATNDKAVIALPQMAANPFIQQSDEFVSLNNLQEVQDVVVLTDALDLQLPNQQQNATKHSPTNHNGDKPELLNGQAAKEKGTSGWTSFLTKHLNIFG